MKSFILRNWKRLILVIAVIAAYPAWLGFTGNFHEVIAGELYRSAQLTPVQIAEYKKTYNIRSIINLRGENKDAAWYNREISASAEAGITHIDFRMSEGQVMSVDRVRQLIAVMKTAPKPLLIHCHSGSNRTSLAAALYLAGVKMHGEEKAEEQISLKYGHVGLPFTDAYAMDETFESVEKTLFGFKS